jgi:hypothetical protein
MVALDGEKTFAHLSISIVPKEEIKPSIRKDVILVHTCFSVPSIQQVLGWNTKYNKSHCNVQTNGEISHGFSRVRKILTRIYPAGTMSRIKRTLAPHATTVPEAKRVGVQVWREFSIG